MIVGAIGFFIYTNPEIFAEKTNKTSEAALVKESLVELSEWTTLKYEYENVIVSRTNKTLPLPGDNDIKYAETIKLIEYSGYLKAGTNLKEIQLTLDEETKQASVILPESQVLDNVAETEKMKVEDIKGNILSDYPTQTIIDEINSNKKQLEEEKINQGFLKEANKRIEVMITDFFNSRGYVVSVEFHWELLRLRTINFRIDINGGHIEYGYSLLDEIFVPAILKEFAQSFVEITYE